MSTSINSLYLGNPGFTSLRDYQHAEKTFRPNNDALAPKSKNWFHIFFQMDQTAIASVNNSLQTAVENDRIFWSGNASNLGVLGILAKNIKLPSFGFSIKVNNQYNRKALTTTDIRYEPINVSFWDDTVDVIRGFWYAYYQYMIQDSRYVSWGASQNQGINIPSQFTPTIDGYSSLYSTSENWGNNYGLDTVTSPNTSLNRTNPFFRSIRIYQFERGINAGESNSYIEYVLVNPIITNFEHDTLDASSDDYTSHSMTISYETVLYNSGFINNDEIASWDAVTQVFFDDTPSILTGSFPSTLNQLGSVASDLVNLGISLDNASGQSPVSQIETFLNGASGTSVDIANAINASNTNPLALQVPQVVSGYGQRGLPPSIITAGDAIVTGV